MKLRMGLLGLMILTGSAWAADAITTGSIRGRVDFKGQVQPEVMRVAGDAVCERLTKDDPPVSEEIVVNKNNTLKNVIVWVESGWPKEKPPAPAKPEELTLKQEKCRFAPHVLAVTVNQPIRLDNADPTLHNVNMQPRNNPRYNNTSFGGTAKPAVLQFKNPEIAVKIKDDIHPWMMAWVAVFDHPDFAISRDDGTFEIPNLMPGEYVIKTWHEKLGGTELSVLVGNDAPADVVLTYTATGDSAGKQIEKNDGETTAVPTM